MDRTGRLVGKVMPTARRLGELVVRAAKEFAHDRCTSFAAAMSYYVLFSIFPLLLLAVGVVSLFVSDQSVSDELLGQITDLVVVSEAGKEDLQEQLNRAVGGIGAVGVIGIVGLVWSASAMMTALRAGLDVAWDVTRRRPYVLGKLVDLLVVLVLSCLFLASVVLTVLRGSVLDVLGPAHPILSHAGSTLLPIVLSFVIFTTLYRVLPAVQTRFRDIWIGALTAALLFELAKTGLAFYFSNFGNYSVIYGSLGAVISFLFFVWAASNIVLYGAEMASEWPRVRAGLYDDEADSGEPRAPLGARLREAVILSFRRAPSESVAKRERSDRETKARR